MSDDHILLTAKTSQRLEAILRTRFAATGHGLVHMTKPLEGQLPKTLVHAIRRLSTQRNRLIHDMGASLESPERFEQLAADIEYDLNLVADIRDGRERSVESAETSVSGPEGYIHHIWLDVGDPEAVAVKAQVNVEWRDGLDWWLFCVPDLAISYTTEYTFTYQELIGRRQEYVNKVGQLFASTKIDRNPGEQFIREVSILIPKEIIRESIPEYIQRANAEQVQKSGYGRHYRVRFTVHLEDSVLHKAIGHKVCFSWIELVAGVP